VEIAADQVRVGDTVIVKPGGHVPVDGVVLGGSSFVEQAAITGEAMPVEKVPGDVVYAGTMNQSGALEITAQKLGRDTKEKEGIVHCTCPGEKTSRAVLHRALTMHFSRIRFLKGSLAAWKAKDYPVEPYREVFHLHTPSVAPR